MSNRVGFILPSSAVQRAYIRMLPWVLVGLAIAPILSGKWNLLGLFKTVALVVIVLAATYWFTKQHKWVYLSSAGIEGSSLRGAKGTISWSDPIALKRVGYSGISGVSVQPASKGAAIFLPLPIANSEEFKSKVNELAPPNHPLRGVGESAP